MKQNKKRLLIATDNFAPRWDGIARFLDNIIPDLKKEYEIVIVAPKFKGSLKEIENVEIYRIPTFNFQVGDFPVPKLNRKIIQSLVKDCDIIWSQTIGPIGGAAIHYAHKFNKKTLAFTHSIEWELVPNSLPKLFFLKNIVGWLTKLYARWTYNKCNLLIVPSLEVIKDFEEAKITSKKVIIHLGINTNEFSPVKDKSQAKVDLGIDKNLIVIGFCGRIGREKDLPTLHKAFLELKKTYPNLFLLIVGGGIDSLERKIEGKDIRLVGSTDHVVPYLRAMDLFVLPSLTETTSLATMEAMSTEIPVIATPVGHVKKYVKKGYNGYFFKQSDSNSLMKKIELMIKNTNQRRRLGKNARRTIVSKYSWDLTILLIKKVLNNLFEKK